ncbi:hypothetical protein Sango_3093700 [Sesamum angolense]|uniref:RNase H type-1 domain-containing protein n=1 Tax=Sesamum angolense TaxID=2727404 RepID=A0AAE1T9S7_9LAMI|nr:hypothetical protein Sango_3093700 [Sesamum angolense]
MSSSHMKLSTILPFHIYAETFRAVQSIREILRIYERASGEVINLQKSEVIFSSNTPEELRPQLTRIMNVRVVEKFDNYFGLLSIVGRSKLEIFNSLCDCIWKRVLGWKEKLLSQAGKECIYFLHEIWLRGNHIRMLDNLMLSLMEDLVASGLVEYPTRSKYSCGVYAIGNPHDLKSPTKEDKHQFELLVMWIGWRDENHALLDCAFARQPIWGNRNKSTMESVHRVHWILLHLFLMFDKWSPPGIGLLKANFDRAIFSNTGDAGLGVIIRNERSKCVAWRSIRIPHIHQAKLAKALATRAAMQACIHLVFSRSF